jgi:hypothetical protein
VVTETVEVGHLRLQVGPYSWDSDHRWIEKDGKIVGRLSGNQHGTWWYQVAAKPHDEPEVMGLADARAAFYAAVRDLSSRK